MTKAFSQLMMQPTVTPAELMETLDEYVTKGSSIHPPAVIRLMDRAGLSRSDRTHIAWAAAKAAAGQSARGFPNRAHGYRAVLAHAVFMK